MSNWDYANQVPTATWRNAMTIPRDLYLIQAAGKMMLASLPSQELYGLARRKLSFRHIPVDSTIDLTPRLKDTTGRYVLELRGSAGQSLALVLSDGLGDQVTIGYNPSKQEFYLDRSASGRTDFHPGFGGTYSAPRLTTAKDLSIRLVVDAASVELFADEGLTVMTGIFFAQKPMTHVRINTTDRYIIDRLTFTGLSAIFY
jgi:fructan beta-fructosidase